MFYMKMLIFTLLLLTTVLASDSVTKVDITNPETNSKKILAILPLPTRSHQNIFLALVNGLLDRGHNVTFVTPVAPKSKHPRLREVLVADPVGKIFSSADISQEYFKGSKNIIERTLLTFLLGPTFNAVILENPKVLALLSEQFDLVITETFIHQEPLLGFAHYFGCPSLNLNPLGYSYHLNDLTGGPINPSFVPNVYGTAEKPETFFDRVRNSVSSVFLMLFYHLYYLPKTDAQMRTVFKNAPPIRELIKNISLTFITNNNALMHAVPLSPSVIDIAGVHIKLGESLSDDLRKWIEEWQIGIVYFSLGSNLKANLLPNEKREAIFASFGKLKQRVLVKWNGNVPANAPENCRFEEWLPQQAVLAHSNTRVFISHGGLLSTQESVYFGVPMIGMPVLGDQFMNMEMASKQGFAIKVSIYELTTDILDAALNKVINNTSFRDRSKEVSLRFRLDPIPALEKAVYYTEKLMQLGNLKHLQPSSVDLNWYQYILLDVLALIAIIMFVAWRIIRCFGTYLIGRCCKRSKTKKE